MIPHPATVDRPAVRRTAGPRVAQILIGVLVSGFLLWLTVRQIRLADVAAALQQANLWYLVPAIVTYFVDLGVRTWRWRVLLSPVRPVRWRDLYPVVTIGYMSNMLLPARMGELVRAAVLARRGVAASAALGSIATERVLDGLTTVAILLVASRFLVLPDWLVAGLVSLTALFVGVLVALIALLAGGGRVDAWLEAHGRQAPLIDRVRALLVQFTTGAGALRRPRLLVRAILIGLLAWSCSALQYFWVFRAFGLPLGIAAAFFAVGAVGLSSAIPAAPGYVGSFEFVGVASLGLLGGPAGIAPGVALSAIMVIHLLQIAPVTVAGMFFAWREGFSLRRYLRRPEGPEGSEASQHGAA